MAFPPTQPSGMPAGDGMVWTSAQDLSASGNHNVPTHIPTYNDQVNAFFWHQQQHHQQQQQQAQLFGQNLNFVDPRVLITQTAPPFRADQSHVSDHRQYHTDSHVNEVQASHNNGFGSIAGIARAQQNTGDTKFLMVSRPSILALYEVNCVLNQPGQSPASDSQQTLQENLPIFHAFMPRAVDTPKAISPELTTVRLTYFSSPLSFPAPLRLCFPPLSSPLFVFVFISSI
jgi:hypothetical protein